MKLALSALTGALLMAGCAATAPTDRPISVETITFQDIVMGAMILGVDPMVFLDPTLMTPRDKRIAAGVCFASRKVNTRFDEQAESVCGPLAAGLLPPPVPKAPE